MNTLVDFCDCKKCVRVLEGMAGVAREGAPIFQDKLTKLHTHEQGLS